MSHPPEPLKTPVGFRVAEVEQLAWDEYERFPGRHKAELTEAAGLRHTRANFIRQEPGPDGERDSRGHPRLRLRRAAAARAGGPARKRRLIRPRRCAAPPPGTTPR